MNILKYSAFSVPQPMLLFKRNNKSALCAFAIFHEGPWGLKAKIKCFLRTINPFNGVGIRNTLFNFFGPCVFKHHRVPVFSYHVSNLFCNGL